MSVSRFRRKPPIIKKLDFSEFHPLDHNLRDCIGYPGGRWRHIKYRWEFQLREEVRARTTCKLGLHLYGPAWKGSGRPHNPSRYLGHFCVYCHERMPEGYSGKRVMRPGGADEE